MFFRKSVWVLILLLIAFTTARTQKMQRIASGQWGGEHISIKVGTRSAEVEYDCATGRIDGPLTVDADGNFNLRGIHRMERGGPVRADETVKEHPATFIGTIKGNTMTLTLKLEGLDPETFTLERGKPGELFKCK